jgi:hypothetical protein
MGNKAQSRPISQSQCGCAIYRAYAVRIPHDPGYNDRIGRDKSRGHLGRWGGVITDADQQRASPRDSRHE